MRYALEQYDKNGFLKLPSLVWILWLFLAKGCVVFIVAAASRQNSVEILTIIYPQTQALYYDMLLGGPVLILMWLVGLRHPERNWINRIVDCGRGVTIALIAVQFIQVGYQVYLDNGRFHWISALTLLLLLWFMLYAVQSRRLKDSFKTPNFNHQPV